MMFMTSVLSSELEIFEPVAVAVPCDRERGVREAAIAEYTQTKAVNIAL